MTGGVGQYHGPIGDDGVQFLPVRAFFPEHTGRPPPADDVFLVGVLVRVSQERVEHLLLRLGRPWQFHVVHGTGDETGMRVGIHQSRQDEAATEVELPRVVVDKSPGITRRADKHEAPVVYRHGLDPWLVRIDSVDAPVCQDQLGRPGDSCWQQQQSQGKPVEYARVHRSHPDFQQPITLILGPSDRCCTGTKAAYWNITTVYVPRLG